MSTRIFASQTSSHVSPTRNSEGVIAYYWSQFDIPVEDLEILPEFSEERVLDTLEKALAKRSMQDGVRILEITASCRYPLWAWGVGGRGGCRWHSRRRVR